MVSPRGAVGLPRVMRAAYVEGLGPPETIRVGDLPVPDAGPTDVVVAVELVAANPVDALVRSGAYPTRTPFPFVLGRDLVGRVAAAGAGSGFTLGEAVWCNSLGHDGRQGSFAGYALVPAERCYRLPAGVDPAVAVAAVHPAATAVLGLLTHARLRPGETVYVGGAAGNVGSAAVAVARRSGARVLAGARPADHPRCLDGGAELAVDYRDRRLGERLRGAAPAGVDVFWETSGHHDFDLVAATVAPGGRVLLTAGGGVRAPLPVGALYPRDVALHGFVLSRASVAGLAGASRLVNAMLPAGELRPRISDVLPLAATPDVHARLDAGTVSGRILLRP